MRAQQSLMGMAVILTCSVLASTARAQVCGDADGNGQITVTDGVNVLRQAAGLPGNCSLARCDADGNGLITVTDGVNVLRAAAGLPVNLSCAQLRFLGVFRETQEQFSPAADKFPNADNAVGDTGTSIVLGVSTTVPTDVNGDGDLDGGFLGLENNLDQSVNVQNVKVEIFIPGAVLGNPVVTDSVPMPISLPPATVDDQGVRTPSKSFAQTIFVQPDVLAFLAGNQNLLPLLPFNMTVVMTITGDSFDPDEISYPVTVRAPNP